MNRRERETIQEAIAADRLTVVTVIRVPPPRGPAKNRRRLLYLFSLPHLSPADQTEFDTLVSGLTEDGWRALFTEEELDGPISVPQRFQLYHEVEREPCQRRFRSKSA